MFGMDSLKILLLCQPVSAVRVGGSFKKKLDKFRENHPIKYDSIESV